MGKPVKVEGRIDIDQCIDILDNHLLHSLEKSGILEEDHVFQQDNNPKNTSKNAKKWMGTMVSLS